MRAINAFTEKVLIDEEIAKTDGWMEELIQSQTDNPRRTILQTVQSGAYRSLKSKLRQKVEEGEGKSSATEATEQSEPKGEMTSVELDLNLSSLLIVFRRLASDVDEELKLSDPESSDFHALMDEKCEIETLLERGAKLPSDDKDRPAIRLNFHRDVKDRYKGGKK